MKSFESVKSQIEKTSEIDKLEAHWVKDPREKLKESWVARTPVSVRPDMAIEGKFDIHTHPNKIKPSFPSFQDLLAFNEIGSRMMVVASMTPEGKVCGYTFVAKSSEQVAKKTKIVFTPAEYDKNERCKKIGYELIPNILAESRKVNLLPASADKNAKLSELSKKYHNLISELYFTIDDQIKKNDWRMRMVPMEGFTFKDGSFVPKPPPAMGSGGVVIQNMQAKIQEMPVKIIEQKAVIIKTTPKIIERTTPPVLDISNDQTEQSEEENEKKKKDQKKKDEIERIRKLNEPRKGKIGEE